MSCPRKRKRLQPVLPFAHKPWPYTKNRWRKSIMEWLKARLYRKNLQKNQISVQLSQDKTFHTNLSMTLVGLTFSHNQEKVLKSKMNSIVFPWIPILLILSWHLNQSRSDKIVRNFWILISSHTIVRLLKKECQCIFGTNGFETSWGNYIEGIERKVHATPQKMSFYDFYDF